MSTISFRDTASNIDRLYPPTSMIDLLQRFRYPDIIPCELPIADKSFRNVASRVTDPINKKIEFIHYNTWLIEPKVDLETFIKIIGGFHRFVICLGFTYTDFIIKALEKLDTDKICDALFEPYVEVCGVSPNPANDICKAASGASKELVSYIIEELGKNIDAFLDFFDLPFNFFIDIIFELSGLNLRVVYNPKAAPELDKRADEIGAEVSDYDWVSLCEVWDQSRKNKILKTNSIFDLNNDLQVSCSGPPDPPNGAWQTQGSGLLIFSPTYNLECKATHLFKKTGVQRLMPGGCDFGPLVDVDHWARKGIQLSILNIDNARVELYSTHLYSGGDLADAPLLGLAEPTPEEKADVKLAQVDELKSFIRATHDPRNVAIIAGDFNIEAISSTYKKIVEKLFASDFKSLFPGFIGRQIQFDDWWGLKIFRNIFPKGEEDSEFQTQGHTNRDDDTTNTFDTICKIFPPDLTKPNSGSLNDYYCDESKSYNENATGERIDFIFIERPTELHSFMLDISRVRRRAFKRSDPPSPQPFLSDHLGLEITLFVSPKS